MARGVQMQTENNVAQFPQGKNQPKSDAFVNMYLTLKSGRRVQVGFIGLSKQTEMGEALIEKLATEEGLKAFQENLTFEFREVQAPLSKDDFSF